MSAERRLAIQFAALVLIWSTSFLWIKLVVVEVPPAWLAVWRLMLGATILSIAAILAGHRMPSGQWPVIVVVAILGNAMPYSLIHAGELSVDSGVAAVLMGTMPLATFVLAKFILNERLNGVQMSGLAAGFAGLLLLVGADAVMGLGSTSGQLLVAAGAGCYALSATLVRKLGSTSTLSVVAVTLWLAAVCMLPFAWYENPAPILPVSPTAWIALFVLGAACTGGAAVLYFMLLEKVPANKFAQINYVIPVLGYGWGLMFMGEAFRWQAVAATILIVIGVRAVVSGKPSQRAKIASET